MIRKLYTIFFVILFVTSCNFESTEEDAGGGLFHNNKKVEDAFKLRVPSNGTYKSDNILTFVLSHPIELTVTGTPQLELTIGADTRVAQYATGSGTKFLVFTYTILAADDDSDGIEVASAIDLNGGTISYTNNGETFNTTTSISTVASTEKIFVDSTGPSLSFVTPPLPNTYYKDQSLSFLVVYDSNTFVTGTPQIEMDINGTTAYATYQSGSGTTNHIFNYKVQATHQALNFGELSISSPLQLNGGFIGDDSGNEATLTYAPFPMPTTYINGAAPFVEEFNLPYADTYFKNDIVSFDLVFNEAVIVSGGTPTIELDIGGSTVEATYITGSGTKTINFNYIVKQDDEDLNGLRLSNAIILNGATIQNADGMDAKLSIAPPLTPSVIIDGTIPEVTAINLPPDQIYMTGESLDFLISFSKSVDVTNAPRLQIQLDSGMAYADYLAGSGTTQLTFRFVPTAPDGDNDGIEFASNIIDLNTTGTLKGSASAQNANLDFSTLAPFTMTGIKVNQSIPTKLIITNQPSDTDANITIAPAITVEVRDSANALVTTATNTISLSFGTDPSAGAASISGTLTTAAVAGVATFNNISVDSINSRYTFDLTSAGLTTAVSNPFDITFAPPTQLVITTQPSNAVAGFNISPAISIELRDIHNNLVTTATDNITLALGSDPSTGSATLGGTTTVAAISGVATFSDITLDKAYNSYVIIVSSGTLTTDTSASFNISPAAKSKLVFVTQPINTTAGESINPAVTVELRDIYNNLVSNSTDNVTLAINTDPSAGTASLAGTLTVAAVGGIATFSDLSIDKAFTGYDLITSSAALTTDTSSSFDISAAANAQLSFVTQPSTTEYNSSIAPSITVEVLDTYGNLTASTAPVSIAINNNPSLGTLSGTTTVNATAGIATFSDLNIDTAGIGYTFDATAAGMILDTSSSFDITATPTQLTITTQPVDTDNGLILPDVVVEVRDDQGNLISNATHAVTLAIDSDPSGGSATLGGTLTVNAVSGVATFNDLTIDEVNTGYSFILSATGLTSATSTNFNITQAPATQLAFITQPTNAVAGVNIAPSLRVELRDANNILVPTATDNITIALNTDPSAGAATLGGTLTIAASGGIATFTNINLDKAFTAYDLIASAAGITSDTSTSFNITPANKSYLAIVNQPSGSGCGNSYFFRPEP